MKPSLLLLLAFAMLPCAAARAQSTESADDTNIWINGFIALRGGDANAGTDSFPDPLYLVSTTGRYMLYKDVTDVSIASYPSCNTANCPPFYYVQVTGPIHDCRSAPGGTQIETCPASVLNVAVVTNNNKTAVNANRLLNAFIALCQENGGHPTAHTEYPMTPPAP